MTNEVIQCNPEKFSGVPTVGSFRFSVAQLIAELADDHGSVSEIADEMGLPVKLCKDVLFSVAEMWDRAGDPREELSAAKAEIATLRASLDVNLQLYSNNSAELLRRAADLSQRCEDLAAERDAAVAALRKEETCDEAGRPQGDAAAEEAIVYRIIDNGKYSYHDTGTDGGASVIGKSQAIAVGAGAAARVSAKGEWPEMIHHCIAIGEGATVTESYQLALRVRLVEGHDPVQLETIMTTAEYEVVARVVRRLFDHASALARKAAGQV